MVTYNFSINHILGLKIRELRALKNLSFQELSRKTGLSISYLSEIEKGKKYPKGDKLMALANAFEVSYDALVSLQVSKKLQPVINLLNSDFFKEFPLEIFGLDPQKVVELLSQAPEKVNAFIHTVINIARNYEMRGEHFYLAALRSYQEMHDNYLEEIEQAVKSLSSEFPQLAQLPLKASVIENVLKEHFGITVSRDELSQEPTLRDLRSYYVEGKSRLLLNTGLTSSQEGFLLARELAFHCLKLKKRPLATPPLGGEAFDVVLNNYKASYFAAALIMPEDVLVEDISAAARLIKLDDQMLVKLLEKYNATPEMLMQRLTNLLPHHFGLKNLFFLRFVGTDNFNQYDLTKELHLSRAHSPHGNGLNEHYCRRWISIRLIKQLRSNRQLTNKAGMLSGAQISRYYGTNDEYLCLTLAFPNVSNPAESISVTIGFYIDEGLKKRIRFIEDPSIKSRIVNTTCQRCAWTDCEDRIAPPIQVEKQRALKETSEALERVGSLK